MFWSKLQRWDSNRLQMSFCAGEEIDKNNNNNKIILIKELVQYFQNLDLHESGKTILFSWVGSKSHTLQIFAFKSEKVLLVGK